MSPESLNKMGFTVYNSVLCMYTRLKKLSSGAPLFHSTSTIFRALSHWLCLHKWTIMIYLQWLDRNFKCLRFICITRSITFNQWITVTSSTFWAKSLPSNKLTTAWCSYWSPAGLSRERPEQERWRQPMTAWTVERILWLLELLTEPKGRVRALFLQMPPTFSSKFSWFVLCI